MTKEEWQLAGVSFIILFLELLVIRLISTEIRIFAYFSNLILLGVFVGSGIGMFLKKRFSPSVTSFFLFLICVIVLMQYIIRLPTLEFKLFSGITELLAPLSEAYVWFQIKTFSKTGIFIGLFLTILLFLMISFCFIPLGQYLGNILDKHKFPIRAYSINVAASLLGMWAFYSFSIFGFSPILGIVLAQGLLIILIKERYQKILAVCLFAITIAFVTPKQTRQPYEGPTTFWSPYQKLTLSPIYTGAVDKPKGFYLEVNNVGHMGLFDLSEVAQAAIAGQILPKYKKFPADIIFLDHYSIPYKFKPEALNVLIVGAGAGNDVAASLRAQIPEIDAVEIDPMIIDIGRKYHPEQPYLQKNVNLIIGDGRTFFQQTPKKYDLVIMGLADSHTTSSSLTNIRLDNYLYTKESLEDIKKILSPDGILFLEFEVTRPWIGERLQKTMSEVFGHAPKVFEVKSEGAFGWGAVIFTSSLDPKILDEILNSNKDLSSFIKRHTKDYESNINPLTDDWPYLYLDKKRLPIIHLLISLILIITLLSFRKVIIGKNKFNLDFFALGAAFMLFEFQNISKSSLLFGNTWITNLFIITAILILILLANFAVSKKILSIKLAYFGLFITLLFQFFIPLPFLNKLPYFLKIIMAPILLNLPLFFSGIIFAGLFGKTKNRSAAFASNLFGSAFGGLLEMFSFLFGISSLLLATIGFYAVAFFSGRKN